MWKKLSAREREVLDLVVRGLSNKEIIGRPGITIEGVRWHLRNIYEKLQVHSRTEVLVKFRSDHNSNPSIFPKISGLTIQPFIQIPRGANEGDVRKRLRKISQMLAASAKLLGVKAKMI